MDDERNDALLTAREIVDIYLNNGLIKTCVDYQFAKVKDKSILQFKDDFFQDLMLILYTYDVEKLNDAHKNNHFNALVTRIIINNIWSNTSPFYREYRKFNEKTDEITPQIIDTYGD